MYITVCKIVNGKLFYSTGRAAQCDDLEGWDGGH